MKDENDNKIELCQPLGSEHCGAWFSLFQKKNWWLRVSHKEHSHAVLKKSKELVLTPNCGSLKQKIKFNSKNLP
jgi:hypothetical protein